MNSSTYLCFFFCCFVYLCNGQKDRDYILTQQKDTLFGKINIQEGANPIKFIHNKLKLTYHPSTIQSFGVFRDEGYQRYKTLSSKGGKTIFVEILVQGKINLYKYSEKHILSNTTIKRYVYLMGTADSELMTISSSSYQRILSFFLKEYPNLRSQLVNYAYDEVPQIIEQYNKLF